MRQVFPQAGRSLLEILSGLVLTGRRWRRSCGRLYVLRRCLYVLRGCLYVLRGCLYVLRGCLYVLRGCLYVLRRCLCVLRGRLVDGIAELADAMPERFGKFGETFRAQHDQRNGSDEQQVNWVLDAHHRSD